MKDIVLMIFIIVYIFAFSDSNYAIESNLNDETVEQQDSTQADIKFKNSSGEILLQILDEGNGSSIILPPLSSIGNSDGKLYNMNNMLYWNNTPIGKLQSENGWSLVDENVILSNPNSLIGIGTENPEHKIHLENGTIYSNGSGNLFYGLTINNQSGRSIINLSGTTTESNYNGTEIIMKNLNDNSSWRILNSGSNIFSLVNHSAATGFETPFKVEFGAPTNSFVISSKGNIGIGALSNEHKLAVAGSIISEEVVVKLQSNWPDYVFTENYELTSLDEVEKFVNKNGHLKGMPSEEEIIEKGINITEVQIKLLEKIEELTLYIIQQNEDIKTLKNEIEEMKRNDGNLK